jgi:glutathione peroxidase
MLKIHAKIEVNGNNEHPMYTELKEACPSTVKTLGEKKYMFWDVIKTTDIHWNFEKFIIDRAGRPRYRFHPAAWGNNGSFVEPYLVEILKEQSSSGSG